MGIYANSSFAPAIKINQPIIPSGTLSITGGSGLYNVYSYSSISVDIQDLLDIRLTSQLDLNEYTDNTATIINAGAFAFQKISKVNMPNVSTVGSYAFNYCTTLTEINIENCSAINTSAFNYCSRLTSINLPNCLSVGDNAFQSCYSLSYINLPKVSSLANTFRKCRELASISLPSCTSLGGYVFYNCSYALSSIYLPNCIYLNGYNNFYACGKLTFISIPVCTLIGTSCFQSCSELSTISIPACTVISAGAFSRCYNLLSVYLNVSSVPSLPNADAFNSTPISNYTTSTGGVYGSIFVPTSLYSSFIAATNWATYSSRIVSMNF